MRMQDVDDKAGYETVVVGDTLISVDCILYPCGPERPATFHLAFFCSCSTLILASHAERNRAAQEVVDEGDLQGEALRSRAKNWERGRG